MIRSFFFGTVFASVIVIAVGGVVFGSAIQFGVGFGALSVGCTGLLVERLERRA